MNPSEAEATQDEALRPKDFTLPEQFRQVADKAKNIGQLAPLLNELNVRISNVHQTVEEREAWKQTFEHVALIHAKFINPEHVEHLNETRANNIGSSGIA